MPLSNKELKEITEQLQDIAYVMFETTRTHSAEHLQKIVYRLEEHLAEA